MGSKKTILLLLIARTYAQEVFPAPPEIPSIQALAKDEAVYLYWDKLQNTYLSEANLSDAALRETNLRGDNIWEPNLTGPDLRASRLSKAKLGGADLQGADLPVPGGKDRPRPDLTETNLSFARHNSDTKFPKDFDPEAAGMVLKE